jgi:ESS family glutamate:Na+ symporter
VWGSVLLFCTLLGALMLANMLKKWIKPLEYSLIPTSVMGGLILLLVSAVYKWITGDEMFNTSLFGGSGSETLEILTYHCLALGFIASAFKGSKNGFGKKRATEIFDSGVTTVATYLLQGVVGMGITMLAAWLFMDGFFGAAGILLPFGYGQGSGQAMNYGNIYEMDHGFVNGKSFGLTIAAMGFLSAALGGVIHLNFIKHRRKVQVRRGEDQELKLETIQGTDEIPMQGSMDKMTVQIAYICVAYFFVYILMNLLGKILPGMKSVIFGFNCLLGVLVATIMKSIVNLLHKKKIIRKKQTNDFLMTRASNFFFDLMVVAGVAAIRLDILGKYWAILLVLGVVGLIVTYVYNLIVARTLFKEYSEEQFLAMYGMLTGTASTGIILLRELDGTFETPASDNLVYQTLPAIVFGFPMMLLATLAPKKPVLTLIIFAVFFLALNIILFRSFIFKKKK